MDFVYLYWKFLLANKANACSKVLAACSKA